MRGCGQRLALSDIVAYQQRRELEERFSVDGMRVLETPHVVLAHGTGDAPFDGVNERDRTKRLYAHVCLVSPTCV